MGTSSEGVARDGASAHAEYGRPDENDVVRRLVAAYRGTESRAGASNKLRDSSGGIMTETLRVDPGALRSLGVGFEQHAASIDALTPAESVRGAAPSMPGSAVGRAATAVGEPIAQAFSTTAKALVKFAANASASAAGYEESDQGFGRALAKIAEGHR